MALSCSLLRTFLVRNPTLNPSCHSRFLPKLLENLAPSCRYISTTVSLMRLPPTSQITCHLPSAFVCSHRQKATPSIDEQGPIQEKLPLRERIRRALGFLRRTKKSVSIGTLIMYQSITENVDYDRFIRTLEMPDTMFSWYLVTELHLWMALCRLRSDNEREMARFAADELQRFFWMDLEKRMNLLDPTGSLQGNAKKKVVKEIYEQMQAALFIYDDGYFADDKTLAGAVWRRLKQVSGDDPRQLETVVRYIRQNMELLMTTPFDYLTPDDPDDPALFLWIELQEIDKAPEEYDAPPTFPPEV